MDDWKILEAKAAAERISASRPAGAPKLKGGVTGAGAGFEGLLGKVARELEALKDDSSSARDGAAAEGISRPEDLAKALEEAGRKYDHCMRLGKHLLKAYEATVGKREPA